jgi:hypothetical protein
MELQGKTNRSPLFDPSSALPELVLNFSPPGSKDSPPEFRSNFLEIACHPGNGNCRLCSPEQFQELRRVAERSEKSSLPDGRADWALWHCSTPFLKLL